MAIHTVLRWDHDTSQTFTHTAFFAFSTQRIETWSRRKIWLTMENRDHIWHNECKFYRPLEHLATDEVTVKFKGTIIFRQYISKKRNVLASKFTNCVMKQGIHVTRECTCVKIHALPLTTWLQHTTVGHWTSKVEGLGHKIFMDNFFFISKTFWWLR
jgi:hypothetical protein